MGFLKNLINKIRNRRKLANDIAKTTQIGQSDQKKFDIGLKKASGGLKSAIDEVVKQHVTIDQNLLNKIEEMLLSYDVGTNTTFKIMQAIEEEIKYQNVENINLIKQIIIDKILVYYIHDSIIDNNLNIKDDQTNVILISGANGVGKTTTIAKLAK